MEQVKQEERKHLLVLFNDPYHSFDYVIQVLTDCIPNISKEIAVSHAQKIHNMESSIIYVGELEHIEYFQDLINSYNPEIREEILLNGEITSKSFPPLATRIIEE